MVDIPTKEVQGHLNGIMVWVLNLALSICTLGMWKLIPPPIRGKFLEVVTPVLSLQIMAIALSTVAANIVVSIMKFISTGILGYPYGIIIGIDPDIEIIRPIIGFIYFSILTLPTVLPKLRSAILHMRGEREEEDRSDFTFLGMHKKAFAWLFTGRGIATAFFVLAASQTIFLLRVQFASIGFVDKYLSLSWIQYFNPGYWILWAFFYMLGLLISLVLWVFIYFIFSISKAVIAAISGKLFLGSLGDLLNSLLDKYVAPLVHGGFSWASGSIVGIASSIILGFITYKLNPSLLTYDQSMSLSIFPYYWTTFLSPIVKIVIGIIIWQHNEKIKKFFEPMLNTLTGISKKIPGLQAIGLVSKEKAGKEKILLDEYKDLDMQTLITMLKKGTDEDKNSALDHIINIIQNDTNRVRHIRLSDALQKEYKDAKDFGEMVGRLLNEISKEKKK